MKPKNLGCAKNIEELRNWLNEVIEEFGPECEWLAYDKDGKNNIIIYDSEGDRVIINGEG